MMLLNILIGSCSEKDARETEVQGSWSPKDSETFRILMPPRSRRQNRNQMNIEISLVALRECLMALIFFCRALVAALK
jgi:hypothetical protein